MGVEESGCREIFPRVSGPFGASANKETKAVYTRGSRVRVARGSDDKLLPKHLGRSSNAKTARNAEKANADGWTDGQTD